MDETIIVDTEVCRCYYCGIDENECDCAGDTDWLIDNGNRDNRSNDSFEVTGENTVNGYEWIGTLPIVATRYTR